MKTLILIITLVVSSYGYEGIVNEVCTEHNEVVWFKTNVHSGKIHIKAEEVGTVNFDRMYKILSQALIKNSSFKVVYDVTNVNGKTYLKNDFLILK